MPDFDQMRATMIDSQLRPSGVSDPRIVEAFAAVPREMFVPPAFARVAYVDAPIGLGGGRGLMEPLTLGRLLEATRIGRSESVLIVGGTTGYSAAVISKLAAKVTLVEEHAPFVDAARGTLATLGVEAVVIVEAPLTAGAPDCAPYDVLLLDGAVDVVPETLLGQVREGGRVVCVRVEDGVGRATAGVVTVGRFAGEAFAEAPAPGLPGFARAKIFQF